MRLVDILDESTIKVPLQNTEKYALIEELVDLLKEAAKIDDCNKVLKAILDREAVMSTGVGDGVAIPHGKSDGAPNIVAALGIAPEPVDFEAIDNKPVQLIWLLIGPPGKTGAHLKALSRISRLMHNAEFRERLIAAKTPAEVLHEVSEEEKKYFEL